MTKYEVNPNVRLLNACQDLNKVLLVRRTLDAADYLAEAVEDLSDYLNGYPEADELMDRLEAYRTAYRRAGL